MTTVCSRSGVAAPFRCDGFIAPRLFLVESLRLGTVPVMAYRAALTVTGSRDVNTASGLFVGDVVRRLMGA